MLPRVFFFSVVMFVGAARAQSPRVLVLEEDPIPDVGDVTHVRKIGVANDGSWMLDVDTNYWNGGKDGVYLLNGVQELREGDRVLSPQNAKISFFVSFSLAPDGTPVYSHFLYGTGSFNDDGGLYLDDQLLAQEGSVGASSDWIPGTTYVYFANVQANASRDVLLRGYVDDPLVAGLIDYFVSVMSYDAAGNVVGERVIAKEEDVFPGELFPVGTVRFGEDRADLNDSGHVIFSCELAMGQVTVGDERVMLWDGAYQTLVVDGDPSPVPGRTWGSNYAPGLSLNGAGDWTLRGHLDNSDPTTDQLIVRNGAVVHQKGDRLPSLGDHRIVSFGTGAAHLTEAGDMLWYAEWDDPTAGRNSGLLLNDRLIVQEGVTMVDGVLLNKIDGEAGSYTISPNGRWVLFEGRLRTGRSGAFLLDLEDPLAPFCFGLGYGVDCPCGNGGQPGAGCNSSLGVGGGRLVGDGDPSVANDGLSLSVTGIPRAASVALLQGDATEDPLPFGDGLRCVGGGVQFVAGGIAQEGTASFGQAAGVSLSTLGAVPARGATRYYQVVYRNRAAFCTPMAFNVSNAIRVEWAP